MRLLVQRVSSASVTIDNLLHSSIGSGLLVLVGISDTDSETVIPRLAKKLVELRILENPQGKMNLSVLDTGGAILLVSQFTLYADCRRGRRPDFIHAAKPLEAERLYNIFIESVRAYGVPVCTGVFGAMMQVNLVNDGPVTILLDSDTL